MKSLYLEDLKELSQEEIKAHLCEEYANDSETEYDNDSYKQKVYIALEDMDIVIAYESVGSWGCDSTSFFLFRRKSDGTFFENHGSHCSCNGFEGQFSPEETTLKYLKSDNFNFYCGGYDDNKTANQAAVKAFIAEL